MKVKYLDRESTLKEIENLQKRITFNNELNKFVRKFMKDRGLDRTFNGYHDMATQEMRIALETILDKEDWMPTSMKQEYLNSCGEIFGQVYSPAVNTYLRTDLRDCENHILELESASKSRREENSEFRVERDLGSNRMNLYFDSIPEDSIRYLLKKNGFRWSPYLQAWTRQLTQNAEVSLEKIKKEIGL